MTIHVSSVLMPLAFGAVGGALGATGLFWTMATLVSSGSLVARQLDLTRGAALDQPELAE
jgi:ABC-type transport system involved in cytochrome c biogenesis permease subunit